MPVLKGDHPLAALMDPMQSLLERLQNAGIPMNGVIEEAMMQVDVRTYSDFDPTPFFHDRPLVFLETPSGGVKTISAPHMVATLLSHLELSEGQDVVIIGAKGGYFAALISAVVGDQGNVTVFDPSQAVLEHVEERLHSLNNCNTRLITTLAEAPEDLPSELNRVLISGSLKQIPAWLEEALSEGGFIVAPLGGEVNQRLVKREKQGLELFDTELGSVVFGPVDIKDSEPGIPSPDALADMLEEAASFARLYDIMEEELICNIENLVTDLRTLPPDLPPPELILFDEQRERAEDEDEEETEEHPLLVMLDEAKDWLMGLWPLLSQLFNVRLQQPGAPEDDSGATGFSSGHEDLIP